jgi:predicted GNAT superfamily acetyltransferase
VEDVDAFLALNRQSVEMLAPLDEQQMQALLEMAYCAWLTPQHEAMLIALDQTADYDSPNFCWFAERYPRFVYVDRVAVAPQARGRGIARALYERLIAHARRDRHTVLCAEIYFEPPNPASDAFHESMRFIEVGRAYLSDRDRSVRYLVREL